MTATGTATKAETARQIETKRLIDPVKLAKGAFAQKVEYNEKLGIPTFSAKQGMLGVYTCEVFSLAFLAELTDAVYKRTTMEQRATGGIDLTASFLRFGDALAAGLEPTLVSLRADAKTLHERKFTDPHLLPWLEPRTSLRFVEAIAICYDELSHTHIGTHTDDKNLTLNVCLGRDGFRGGDLIFSCRSAREMDSAEALKKALESKDKGKEKPKLAAGAGLSRGGPLVSDSDSDSEFEEVGAQIHMEQDTGFSHDAKCAMQSGLHEFKQTPGSGFLHLGVIPHRTTPVTRGERVNLVLKFSLVPRDGDVAAGRFRRFGELFGVLQRRVFSFLDIRSLCYAGQASKALDALSAEPSLWRAMYARQRQLSGFVSEEELLSGAHLQSSAEDKATDKESQKSVRDAVGQFNGRPVLAARPMTPPRVQLQRTLMAIKRQVRLEGEDWRAAYRACKAAEHRATAELVEHQHREHRERELRRAPRLVRATTGYWSGPVLLDGDNLPQFDAI